MDVVGRLEGCVKTPQSLCEDTKARQPRSATHHLPHHQASPVLLGWARLARKVVSKFAVWRPAPRKIRAPTRGFEFVQSNSASCERLFAHLKDMFGDQLTTSTLGRVCAGIADAALYWPQDSSPSRRRLELCCQIAATLVRSHPRTPVLLQPARHARPRSQRTNTASTGA